MLDFLRIKIFVDELDQVFNSVNYEQPSTSIAVVRFQNPYVVAVKHSFFQMDRLLLSFAL